MMAASCAALAVLSSAAAWAGPAGVDPPPSATEQQRLQSLSGEVSNLKTQSDTQATEIKKIEQEIAVAPPAKEGTPPATIGEHVGLVEKDLTSLKKDLSDNLGIHVHGLVDAGYEYNVNRPDTSFGSKGGSNVFATGDNLNQLRVFDPNANSFNLTQGNIHIDRTADGGVGFVLDLNFGNVANVLGQSTRYSNINPAGTSNTIVDPTQFYLTYTIPVGSGINIQAGRFVTLLGEEIIPVYNNLNYNETRSFAFGFGIPFTHTGIRAQYTFNDYIGATFGVNNGWDDISDNNDGKTMEAELAINNKDKSLSLVTNGIWGAEQVNHDNSKRWVINPVATWKPWFVNNLTLIADSGYGHESGPVSVFPAATSFGNILNNLVANPAGGVTLPRGANWYWIDGYVVYDWSDALEFATRGEFFGDPQGVRTGLRENLGEITQTVSYKIPAVTGLLTRFEYRHDESSAKPFFSSDGFNPLTGFTPLHTYSGQDTLTAAMIYSF
jgi:Putative beta-barrel porin-2, OmpL-like. bbp2